MVSDLAAAVSEGGDAIAIWTEQDFGRRHGGMRVRVARRTAGGAFGAPETLAIADVPSFAGGLGAGVAGDGTAIVTWSYTAGTLRDLHGVADVAIAAPGATLHAGQRLTSELAGGLRLAVSADGHAIVAFGEVAGVRVAERAAGGAFGPARTLGAGLGYELALALGQGPDALVAWRAFGSGIT